MHPRIVGISPELVFRAVKTLMLTEIWRQKETDGGGWIVVTWDE
jgi:hypothetical protein